MTEFDWDNSMWFKNLANSTFHISAINSASSMVCYLQVGSVKKIGFALPKSLRFWDVLVSRTWYGIRANARSWVH